MKGAWTVLAAVAIVAGLSSGPAGAGAGVRVTGGMSYIAYGNFNDFVDNVNALMAAETLGVGEVGNIHWVPEFSGEVLYSFMPTVAVGIGAGVLSGTSTFEVNLGGSGFSFEHTVKAYPITGTVYAKIPVPFTFAKPYVFAGGGAYYTKVKFNESVTVMNERQGYDAELTTWGFGIHGGAGLEISIVPMVAVDIGVSARAAKMKGFTGTATSSDGRTADVFLAYYTSDGAVTYGPELAAEKGNYAEGEVDLSGFAVSLSLKVSF